MADEPDPLRLQKLELAAARLRTNDIVEVHLARRLVLVNMERIEGLKHHDAILIDLLAREAIATRGLPLDASDIVKRIEQGTRTRRYAWLGATQDAVYQSVWRLRQAIERAGFNPHLIERLPSLGYRLSTPSLNILLPEGEAAHVDRG